MAKKQKRSVSTATRPAAVAASAGTGERTVSAPAGRSSYVQEFNPDYSLVLADLKKIGILAGTFITILVVLSFFLR